MNTVVNEIEQNTTKWILAVKTGDPQAINILYKAYRTSFLEWLQKTSSCDKEMATDIFQDSVIALYENIRLGKLKTIDSSVRNYLFGIGKRMYYYRMRKNKGNIQTLDEHSKTIHDTSMQVADNLELSEQEAIILKILQNLKEPCRSIIYLFYYKGLSTEHIAQSLNYKNKKVLRVKKVRCMKLLRQATNKLYKKGDF